MMTESNNNVEQIKIILSDLGSNRRKTIAAEMFEKLREAILQGVLPSGFVFPNENDMCKLLDIGRSTLRECYSSLQILNLITRTKNGTIVNSQRDTHQMRNFDSLMDNSTFEDIMEFREIVEVGIIYNAAIKCTPEDVTELRRILTEQSEANDIERLTELDYEFHLALARLSKNELLLAAFNSVQPKFKSAAYEVFTHNPAYNLGEHQSIVDALELGNSKAAKTAMRSHLRSIAKTFHKTN